MDENVLPVVLQTTQQNPDSSHDAAASTSATVADTAISQLSSSRPTQNISTDTPVDEDRPTAWTGRKTRCQKEVDDAATVMFINLVKKKLGKAQ